MTNEEAINIINNRLNTYYCSDEDLQALDVAIKALERDSKVNDITLHWNDAKYNFVTACYAFEDILKVYGRGV